MAASKIVYEKRDGYVLRTDANNVGRAFAAIRKKHSKLTPALVLQEAEDPNHALHDEFEWDDEAAAHKYRLKRASYLIQSVKVTVITPKKKVISVGVLHGVPSNAQKPFSKCGDYKPWTMLTEEEKHGIYLKAKQQLQAIADKYQYINDPSINKVWSAIKNLAPSLVNTSKGTTNGSKN